jgi:hypothetical protein
MGCLTQQDEVSIANQVEQRLAVSRWLIENRRPGRLSRSNARLVGRKAKFPRPSPMPSDLRDATNPDQEDTHHGSEAEQTSI